MQITNRVRSTCLAVFVATLGAVAALAPATAAAYCNGTMYVPATGITSFDCPNSVTGVVLTAVAGHRSDGKAFVDISCSTGDCKGVAWIAGLDTDYNTLCYTEMTYGESSVICPNNLALYTFSIEEVPQ